MPAKTSLNKPELKMIEDLFQKCVKEGNIELERIEKETSVKDRMGAMYLANVSVICKFIQQLPPVLNEEQAAIVLGALSSILEDTELNCKKLELRAMFDRLGGLLK
jgi:hypothetical protein